MTKNHHPGSSDCEDLSRRKFLRSSTEAAVGAFAIVLLLPEGSAEGTDGADYDWNRHRWVYLVDTTKCIGCGSCVRACRAENSVPEGMYRTWIERYEIPAEGEAHVDSPSGGEHGFDPVTSSVNVQKAFFVPKICNHCRATPCTQVCPVGASFSTRDGVVLVDAEHCIGCGYCVQACPYWSRYINPTTHTADKCTLCYHRITKGLTTACVQACPVGARQLGDRKNPDDPVNQILATQRVQVLQQQLLTKPQCYYLGLDMEVR